jgi:polysaccharide deacetylase
MSTPRPRAARRHVRLLAVLVVLSGVELGAAAALQAEANVPRTHSNPVPILMYHVIASPPAGTPYPELFVRAQDFAGQVAWLARHGYHAVTQRQVYRYWRSGSPLPSRPIVLSFDDGYPQDVDTVLPILRVRRWPAVLNLQIGNLVPARVRVLIRAGWEIDAHTFTHPDLTLVDPTRLTRAGYVGATTTRPGLASPRSLFELSRVRVDGSDGVTGLASKLRALGEPA